MIRKVLDMDMYIHPPPRATAHQGKYQVLDREKKVEKEFEDDFNAFQYIRNRDGYTVEEVRPTINVKA